MKRILMLILITISFKVFAQAPITYTPMVASGYQFRYLKSDSGFALPYRNLSVGDGVNRPGLLAANTADSLLYYYDGITWRQLVNSTGPGASSGADSAFVRHENLNDSVTRFYRTNETYQDQLFTFTGGSTQRFGIEDNLGVQDRDMNMQQFDFNLTNAANIFQETQIVVGSDNIYSGLNLSPSTTQLYHLNYNNPTTNNRYSTIRMEDSSTVVSAYDNTRNNSLRLDFDSINFRQVNNLAALNIKLISPLNKTGDYYSPLTVNGTAADNTGNITIAAGGGNTNSNIGAGYRLAVPNTNNIKTLFAGTNITMDSTTNANGITINSSGGGGATSKQLWVNLADYADSTGVADATAGINTAIAAVPIGGVLYVPNGIYKTSGGHTITKKMTMRGAGGVGYLDYTGYVNFRRGASVIYSTSASATLFNFSGESGLIENIDFRLDSTVSPTTALGLLVSAGTGVRIINNSFYNFNIGVHIQSGGHYAISYSFFRRNTQAIRIQNTRLLDEGDATISHNWIYGSSNLVATDGVAGQTGIKHISGGGLKISDNKFNNGLTNCLDIAVGGASSIALITGNSFENFLGYGIKIDTTTNFQFPQIVNNQFAPYTPILGNCIYLNNVTNAIVTNNTFGGASTNTNYAVSYRVVNGLEAGFNRFTGWTKKDSIGNVTTGSANILRPEYYYTITDAATVTYDANNGTTQVLTMGGNRTINFSNFVQGQEFTLLLVQNGTGGWLPTVTGANWIGNGKINQAPSGTTLIRGMWASSGFVFVQAFPNGGTYTTTQRDAIPNKTSNLYVYNSTTARFEIYNGSIWVPMVTNDDLGSSTSALGVSFGNVVTGTTVGNIYSISVAKANVDYLMMGINKNTLTGTIPASGVFLSTYVTAGNMSLGRGNGGGLPSKADIHINGLGYVGVGNNTALTSGFDATATSAAFAITAKTSAYTATALDRTINCTSGTFTVTIPNAIGITGREYVVKNSGAGAITVSANSNGVATLGAITGGSGYVNATYTNVPLTGGTGTGALGTVTVSGGAVTAVTITTAGAGYTVADALSATAGNLGGSGSGFSVPVATVVSQTIDGANTYSLATQYKYVKLQSTGAAWIVVANN